MGNLGCCGSQPLVDRCGSETPILIPPPEPLNHSPKETEETKSLKKPKRNSRKSKSKTVLPSSKRHPAKPRNSLRFHRGSFVHFTQGDIVSMYKIVSTLGKGSFGRVYKIQHKLTGDQRAVKVLSKENVNKHRSLILSEVEILRSLDHPNILKVFEVYEDEKQFSIVTELCVGGELFDKIASAKKFSEETAAHFMFQIMSAVLTCHEKGIVHRDLKPENILFINDGQDSPLKVIDFGTSKKLESKGTLSSLTGTVIFTQAFYIAPEVIKGNYDFKCDIWSCGVILYIMLCGYPPFGGNCEEVILNNIISGHFTFNGKEWSCVSTEAKSLIMRMLTKNPTRRPTAKDIFNDPWIQNRASRPSSLAKRSLRNLSKFRANLKLQQATLEYIASQLISAKETKYLHDVFISLDLNGDGKLSSDELKQAYKNARIDLVDIERIIEICDNDGNGFIDYTEFLTATINWKKELSHKRLENVFMIFDKDGSGKIGIEEIKQIFGGDADNIEENVWQEIINEADLDGDGEIDLNEFKVLMLGKF